MSSTEIKTVISHLCKLLNLLLDTNLKPEYFRLAKFNESGEKLVSLFWNTLNLLTTKELKPNTKSIKEYMKSLKYSSPNFYKIPENLTSGSRELLLATCFIVATNLQNIINDKINKSPFGEICLVDLRHLEEIKEQEIPSNMSNEDFKNFVMWIEGKIEQNLRMDMEYQTQIKNISEKLMKSRNIKENHNFRLNEVLALNSKKYCKEFVEKSLYILKLLEYYQEWRRREKIFWKWMVTVLHERDKI